MSEATWRLVYFSRNAIPGGAPALEAEIPGILATSQRNNARVGVTGALMFNSGGFAQVLEGRQRDVSSVFERIQCDPRHSDVLVLSFSAVASRLFGHWSMGWVGASQGDRRLFGAVGPTSGFDPDRLAGIDVAGDMLRLMQEEEAAAAAP
jgi:hypothetical protein